MDIFVQLRDLLLTAVHNYVPAPLIRLWNHSSQLHTSTDNRSLLYKTANLTGRREIRLLQVEPGIEEEEIRIDLFTTSLADHPTYEAISYTWATPQGDISLSESITCRCNRLDLEIRVTVNCKEALRHIRYLDRPRTIWIDTVCINQEDVEERNTQVALMSQIYSLASGVIVFLGEGTNNSDMCLDFLRTCAEDEFAAQNRCVTSTLRMALRELLSRAWFRRVWVLQEVALARRVTVICGTKTIPYKYLTSKRLSGLGFDPHRDDGLIPPVLKLSRFGTLPVDLFHSLLHMARPCHSTDNRDKIFALFGMLDITSRHDLRADYTAPVQRVYTEIAVHFIRRYNTLDILSFVEHPSNIDGLPSWVPDWSKPPRLPPLGHTRALPRVNHHVPAISDLPPPQTKWDLSRLAVKGRVVDIVRVVSPTHALKPSSTVWEDERLGSHTDIATLWRLFKWDAFARLEYPVPYNIAVDTAHWVPLQLVHYPFGTEVRGVGSLYHGFALDAQLCTREIRNVLCKAEAIGRGRAFLWGAASIGLGPRETQANDLIVLLEGSLRPVVLRRQQTDLALVGECYYEPTAQTKILRHECCWHVVGGRRKCHRCEVLAYQARTPVQEMILV